MISSNIKKDLDYSKSRVFKLLDTNLLIKEVNGKDINGSGIVYAERVAIKVLKDSKKGKICWFSICM